jgi:hypothetical protein
MQGDHVAIIRLVVARTKGLIEFNQYAGIAFMHGGSLDHNGARARPTSTVEYRVTTVIRFFIEY